MYSIKNILFLVLKGKTGNMYIKPKDTGMYNTIVVMLNRTAKKIPTCFAHRSGFFRGAVFMEVQAF